MFINAFFPRFYMDSRWEERFETSMKEYADNLISDIEQNYPFVLTETAGKLSTDEEYCQKLAELVEAKFNKSVEVVLACMRKAVMTNDNRIHAVDIQNFQVV